MLFLATDHAGFELKEELAHLLADRGVTFEDFGAFSLQPSDDFPQYAKKVAHAVIKHNGKGILLCGSGQGVCIAANRFAGIRAAVAWNKEVVQKAREDDDVNILCLPARFISPTTAWEIVSTFLSTTFSHQDRYKRRIKQIDEN